MSLTPEQRKASFVNRARVSAKSGKWLVLAGVVLGCVGLFLSAPFWGVVVAMGIVAIVLQIPRQIAWRRQSDPIELVSLAAMPIILVVLCYLWLRPGGVLSLGTVLQGLSGFFITLGVFHMITRKHTLTLADEIEQQ